MLQKAGGNRNMTRLPPHFQLTLSRPLETQGICYVLQVVRLRLLPSFRLHDSVAGNTVQRIVNRLALGASGVTADILRVNQENHASTSLKQGYRAASYLNCLIPDASPAARANSEGLEILQTPPSYLLPTGD